MSIVRRRLTAAAAAAVLIPSLAGCYSGFGAQTSQQANQAVGNGVNLTTGDIEIRGATWVRSITNPAEATLVATFINSGGVVDKLVKVDVAPPSQMGITAGAVEVPTAGSVRTGYWSPNFVNAFQLQAFPSTFVSTTFTFQNAGTVTGDVLTVPNTGQYAGIPVTFLEQKQLQKFVAKVTGTNPSDSTTTEKVAKAKQKKQARSGQ
ncbi:MAG TPA: hypothetical protein PLT68_10265 [Actinomycetota bacterium]|nr:hypothetical protein [Actinomycetota bacterium]